MNRQERLVFTLQRQLVPPETVGHQFGIQTWGLPAAGAFGPQSLGKTVPMDNSMVYLGETCVFDITLSNQGAPVSALTLKIECSVEGGSTAVLYDNSQSPLQQLPFNAQEQLRVQTDIKEQGLITIVASAVFTDQSGERKYHVQFFKFSSASPVSVRTRVRHLPHAITASSSSSSSGCGVGKTRCFLEVNVQNSTQLLMHLHAVRLLAAPGVMAQQVAALANPQQQQQVLPSNSHHQQHDQQQHDQQQPSSSKAPSHPQLAPAGASSLNSSDTEMLQDIDSFTASGSVAAAPSVQHKQQQRSFDQSHQQQQYLQPPGQSAFAPFPSPEQQQQQQVVPLPASCSQNCLWQIDHQLAGSTAGSNATSSSAATGGPPPPAAAAGAGGLHSSGSSGPNSSGPISSSSGSSSTLGRLELHWSTSDARTGRLLTQPLTGPVPASGKEVLMQLHRVMPGPPAAHADAASAVGAFSLQGPQQLAASLPVNQPFTAMFTLTAGPHDLGPLLVLYTTMAAPVTSSSSSTGGGLANTGSMATDSSSIQARRLGAAAAVSASDSSCPEVVVQGSRSRRVPGLAAGQSVDVPFELLPLRCGWLRLPTFVVASEADGRLLDGVHDVHVLVV